MSAKTWFYENLSNIREDLSYGNLATDICKYNNTYLYTKYREIKGSFIAEVILKKDNRNIILFEKKLPFISCKDLLLNLIDKDLDI